MIEKVKIKNKSGKMVTGRRITVTSCFPSDLDTVWNEIMKFDTLRYICRPKARFISLEKKSFQWNEDTVYRFRLYAYGFIPMGVHTIRVKNFNQDAGEIITHEYNKIVTVWNHSIKMNPVSKGQTEYTDIVDLYAGFLSSLFAWWTERFYKHRQLRWVGLLYK